jgi:NAD(P)H dehydrogenase (quinone)
VRALVVYCHPVPDSFCAAVRDAAIEGLARAGHEVRLVDLYASAFDPVMSCAARRSYYDERLNRAGAEEHIASVLWAEALIFVYPTWWSGQPAMLKGWLERVFVPGVAFALPKGRETIRPLLTGIRIIAAVTTLGSPRWWWWWMGRPGQRVLLDGFGQVCRNRHAKLWLPLYDMDHAGAKQRARFLARVSRKLAALR